MAALTASVQLKELYSALVCMGEAIEHKYRHIAKPRPVSRHLADE
jgi:hypothetical protein